MTLPAIILSALFMALPLTLLVSSLVLLLYRRSLLRWMGYLPAPAVSSLPDVFDDQEWRTALEPPNVDGPLPTWAALRRRELRFWGLLALLWWLIGVTGAFLYLQLTGTPLSMTRILGLGMAWASPGWMSLGLMARLPWRRELALIIGCVLLTGLILWGSMVDQSAVALLNVRNSLIIWQAVPLGALTLLVGIPSLRATAPLLYPQVLVVTLLALAGQAALVHSFNSGSSRWLLETFHVFGIGSTGILLLAHLVPALAGLWLVHGFSRFLALSYRRRRFSDLSYGLAAAALIVLLFAVIPSWSASPGGIFGLASLLAWVWVPLGFLMIAPRVLAPAPGPAPTLLVLRLFRRPGPVGWLFDQVVQRWRFIGPVLMISAADLAIRTLDADELTDFLDGRLRERFVATPADLGRRLGADADIPDHDGRYRVHEICCYDSSWQGALEALLHRSQLVLMDLRGFQASNLGCLHELRRIAATPSLRRVVLLVDNDSDRDTAASTLKEGRTVCWVEERRRRQATMEALLVSLCQGYVTR
jgi:hypothetical protein